MKQFNVNVNEAHFGETSQDKFWSYRDQYEYSCPTEWSPKYEEARAAAFAAIQKYGLSEDDFWIKKELSNFKDKIIYVNLILSHAGCIKVNEQLPEDRQFKPSCVREAKGGQDGGVALLYSSDEQRLFKTGEASPRNSKMSYLYAAAERRLFDRVVTALSGLYENGIYGEAEADSFAKEVNASSEPQNLHSSMPVRNAVPARPVTGVSADIPATMEEETVLSDNERRQRIEYIKKGVQFTRTDARKMLDFYGVFDYEEMEDAAIIDATSKMENKIVKEKALRAAQQSVTTNGQSAPAPMQGMAMPDHQPAIQNEQELSPIAQMIAGGVLKPASEIPQPVITEEASKETPIGETIYTVTDNAPKSFQDMAGQTLDQIGKEMLRGLYKRANAAGRKYVSPELLATIEQYIA